LAIHAARTRLSADFTVRGIIEIKKGELQWTDFKRKVANRIDDGGIITGW